MKTLRFICITALILGIAATGYAMEKRTAQIASSEGTVQVKAAGQSEWVPANVGMVLNQGDMIKTSPQSWALLDIDQGKIGTVEVKEGSQMLISELEAEPNGTTSKTLLDLALGEVLIKAQKVHGENSKFEVKTPTSIVGVRGTTFNVKVEAVAE